MVIICFFDFTSLKIILIHFFCHIVFPFSISQHQSLNQNPVIAFCNSHCPSQVGNPLHSIFLPNSIPDVFPWESVQLPFCWPPCCFSSKNQPKPSDPPPARGHWPSLGVVKNDISNNNPLVNNMLYVLHNVWYLDMPWNRLQVKSVTLSPLLPPSPSRCYIRQKPISSSPPQQAVVPTTPSHLIHRRATPSGTISTDKLSHTLLCVSLHTQCQRVLSQTDEIREIMIIRHFSWETVAALVGVVHVQLGESVSQRICVFPPLFISFSVPQFPQQFNSCGICVRCRIRGSHRLEAFLPLFTSSAQPPDLPMQNILTGHTTLKLCFINPKKGISDHFYQLTWTQYSHLAAGLRGAWAPSQAWDENTFSTALICIIILESVWKFDEPHLQWACGPE